MVSAECVGGVMRALVVAALVVALGCRGGGAAEGDGATTSGAVAAGSVERGKYLTDFGGCHECHTPKVFGPSGPARDTTRLLSGHPSGERVPPVPTGVISPSGWIALTTSHLTAWAGPWGVSFAANLTPHETGIGAWTAENFIQTMRTGRHFGTGRQILPPMPWYDIARLTDEDLRALFAYFRSLPPVDNRVPMPIPPSGGAPGAGAAAPSGTKGGTTR